MDNLFDENTGVLFDAILSLKTQEDCKNFFSDLCTVKEIKEFSQRFEVARLLSEGLVYSDIAEKTGASNHYDKPCQPQASTTAREATERSFPIPATRTKSRISGKERM